MKVIQIFDSAGHGARNDSAIAADIEWCELAGGKIDRFDVERQPDQVAGNSVVRERLAAFGEVALPLALVEGRIVLSGRYPTRAELARWMLDITAPMGQMKPADQSGDCGCGCGCG